ncbi:MAG: aspartate kinase [Desulfobulbaceae bacterium]|jgi:aspartate kinase|nr:aspartate kinase [Desulfobulbaceae bacterium]
MERIVVKFGGSSLADAGQFRKVKAIIEADQRRKIVVVSAPGKRHPDDEKITDLLYRCHKLAAAGGDFSKLLAIIRQRFAEIATDLALASPVPSALDELRTQLTAGCDADFAASRGEYCCALLMAAYLGAEMIDPGLSVAIGGDGSVRPETYENLGKLLADHAKTYVMAGFYGYDGSKSQRPVKTFSRGGSDISGAIAARAAHAALYENWTDTSGILIADPRLIYDPKVIGEISFAEVREMAYMGASVFHDEAILPVREAGIAIRIRNTNRPNDPGTLITPKLSAHALARTEIAGIAGKQGFSMISVAKTMLHHQAGIAYRLLGALLEHGISFEHCPSSIDSISVIVETEQLAGKEEAVVKTIRRVIEPDSLVVEHNLALLAVVGEGMSSTAGISGKVFTALGKNGVNVRIINQGASEINIIIGVAAEDYEKAVLAIYMAFTG